MGVRSRRRAKLIDAETFHKTRQSGNKDQGDALDLRSQSHTRREHFVDKDLTPQYIASNRAPKSASVAFNVDGVGRKDGRSANANGTVQGVTYNARGRRTGERGVAICERCGRCDNCGGYAVIITRKAGMNGRHANFGEPRGEGCTGHQKMGPGYNCEHFGKDRSPRRPRDRRAAENSAQASPRRLAGARNDQRHGDNETRCATAYGRAPAARPEGLRRPWDGGDQNDTADRRNGYGTEQRTDCHARGGGYRDDDHHQRGDKIAAGLAPRQTHILAQSSVKGRGRGTDPAWDYPSLPQTLRGQRWQPDNGATAARNSAPNGRQDAKHAREEQGRGEISASKNRAGDVERKPAGGRGEWHGTRPRHGESGAEIGGHDGRLRMHHHQLAEHRFSRKGVGDPDGQGRRRGHAEIGKQYYDDPSREQLHDARSTAVGSKALPASTLSTSPNPKNPLDEMKGFGPGDGGWGDRVEGRRQQQLINRKREASMVTEADEPETLQPSAPSAPVPSAGNSISPPRLRRTVNPVAVGGTWLTDKNVQAQWCCFCLLFLH